MSANIDRRTFLAGTTAGSLVLLSLGGCNKPDENKGAIKTSAGSDSGQAKPHYAMVFDQNKCIGCGLCKEACNETNKLPKGVSRLVLERLMFRELRVRFAENSKAATASAYTFVSLVSSARTPRAFVSARQVQHIETRRPVS